MKIERELEPTPRECDGCTACCEGWLQAEALGKGFYSGIRVTGCAAQAARYMTLALLSVVIFNAVGR